MKYYARQGFVEIMLMFIYIFFKFILSMSVGILNFRNYLNLVSNCFCIDVQLLLIVLKIINFKL